VNKNISTIITLYKTPNDKLLNLKKYRNFPLFLFEQEGNLISKKNIEKKLKLKFYYYFSSKNIGLSKASNFLLKKVKTKYLLFTQADISIDYKSILNLKDIFKKDKDIIFVTPQINSKNKISKKKGKFSFVKKINAACMLCDVKKLKTIGFFDEDYFLYWEDIDLMNKINKSKYKMVLANNIYAKHSSNQSSANSLKTLYFRTSNFIYGELVYDLKHKRLRLIKILRKIIQNFFLFFFNIIKIQLKESLKNFFNLCGVIKFILFYLKKD